ncbi:MAG: hypothetical protein WAK82_36450 [Streptosporangiaceae bacterium]
MGLGDGDAVFEADGDTEAVEVVREAGAGPATPSAGATGTAGAATADAGRCTGPGDDE